AAVDLAAANVVKDETNVFIGKDHMVNLDIKMNELCIMKLLNHILQPTIYDVVMDVAREWVIDVNMVKYLKADVVRYFIDTFRTG
ncbi:hypothetical protein, partial [Salmonella enterica]|uniref:hypothetical protein n=1 Tax=Salmonella enterica TaxID=28901 RepID=UPI003299394A